LVAVSLARKKLNRALAMLTILRELLVLGQRAPQVYTCGVFLWLQFASLPLAANCGQADPVAVQVVKVVDGDTLRLKDGRSVRILGVNAPEVAYPNKPGQPLGEAARAAAQAFVAASKQRVYLSFETLYQDRYGRSLAHVYDARGRSLGAELLASGMAIAIAVPPNMAQADCLYSYELQARRAQLGVWSNSYWIASSKQLRTSDRGFRVVRGKVLGVDIDRSAWLTLEGNLAVQVSRKNWRHVTNAQGRAFGASDWQTLKGQTVEVRGWITTPRTKVSAAKKQRRPYRPLLLTISAPKSLLVNPAP
jgi:micrococcal nuclease